MEQGPNLIPKLYDLLIKFRSHPIALIANIEKAFLVASVLVRQFGLFLDNQDILRCRGRLDESTLSLSAKIPKFWFTELVIPNVHQQVKHSRIRTTLSAITERFWILRGREAVKKSLRHCYNCRKVEEVPCRPPDVPTRVSDVTPFTNTWIDFAGPLYVKDTSQESGSKDPTILSKAYALLFTCAATRAIYL